MNAACCISGKYKWNVQSLLSELAPSTRPVAGGENTRITFEIMDIEVPCGIVEWDSIGREIDNKERHALAILKVEIMSIKNQAVTLDPSTETDSL